MGAVVGVVVVAVVVVVAGDCLSFVLVFVVAVAIGPEMREKR